MSDFFVLRILALPRTILDKQYKVVWEDDKAKVYYTQTGEEDWKPTHIERDTELEAWGYITLLASLNWKPDNNWRNL